MNRKVNQIREIGIIEKELSVSKVGILAYKNEKENVNQVVTSFVYFDKNIFAFYEDNDENFDRSIFENNASFSIYKEEKISKENILDFEPTYKFLQVKCTGVIKKVEEQKIIDDVVKAFTKKYSAKSDKNNTALSKLFCLDTEEIQAAEIIGG
ncbi:MAG: hypothetical protein NTX22_14775 [Ignavibacteriales bacterium]|nr:hypothetical protein [Ignavibacteriales bacterium]